jgi:hypothetical protein
MTEIEELQSSIKLFELRRRNELTLTSQRNETYWVELRHINQHALFDLSETLDYLREKRDNFKSHASLFLGQQRRKNSQPIDPSGSSSSSVSVGRYGRRILEEFETSMSSKFQEESNHVDNLIKNVTIQVEAIEREFRSLWAKGDRLLFAVRLSDQRARKNYDAFNSRFTPNGDTTDLWLLEVRYSVAASRSYEVKDESNNQLRLLFNRLKDVESRRRTLVFKTYETIVSRQADLFGSFPSLAVVAKDRLIQAKAEAGDGDNISALLASRVEQEHDSVALGLLLKAQERAREREKMRLANESQGGGEDGAGPTGGRGASASMAAFFLAAESVDTPPPLPFPLHSPHLQESAIFYRRQVHQLVLTAWVPVLLCLTRTRVLHIFELDPDAEREQGAVAAFSNAARRSRKGIELEVLNCHGAPAEAGLAPAEGKENSPSALTSKDPTKLDHLAIKQVLETEQFMAPVASLNMDRCTVGYCPTKADDCTFEVVESIPLAGISSIFRTAKDRKFVLKAADQQTLTEWILKFPTKKIKNHA